MKKGTFAFIIMLYTVIAIGQTHYSHSCMIFSEDHKDLKSIDPAEMSDFLTKYPVSLHKGRYYLSALALINDSFSQNTLSEMNIRTGSITGEFATLRIPLDLFLNQTLIPGIDYLEIAEKISPMLDKAKRDSRVDSIHMGWYLPVPISGNNVIIGITDWGFDYTHPMFYDTSLTSTRILAAWDQFRQAGPPPAGFDYGRLFSGETELLNAQCDTFNIYEYATHGSHVAGIAGGSGAGTIYRGVAFGANYLMATFLVDAAAVIDAFVWMKQYAENAGKRLVINMSWGLYYMGNLDGTSILSQIIDQMSDEGVVFVSSAGNNGDTNFHIIKEFTSTPDTMKTIIAFDNYGYYPKMWGQSITMWGSPEDTFSVALKIYDSQYQNILAETPFYSTAASASYTDSMLVIGSDTILYNLALEGSNPFNMRPHMRLRVQNKQVSTYKVALFATSEHAIVHFWNLIELTNDVGNWGSPFLAPASGWTAGDPYYGIGEPTCAGSVITVASHISQINLQNNTVINGGISNFSSYGPLITEMMKPDLSAPGSSVCSSISSFTNVSIPSTSVVTTVTFNGRTYKFVRFSGTSMSSPHVAGVVALLLEANPLLTPTEIKQILRETARQDDKTGVIPPGGSTRWGWGKLNALLAIYQAMNIQNIPEIAAQQSVLIVPNPATNFVKILSDHFHPQDVFVINMAGALEKHITTLPGENISIDVSNLSSGQYLLFMYDGTNWKSAKFIRL